MPTDGLLQALGHAASGAAGTAISTAATYPLDLVNTRLKVQRRLRRAGTIPTESEQYRGVADALVRTAREREGGGGGLYAGLGSDVAKGVADSFLFFLFYSWFRSRAVKAGGGGGGGGGRGSNSNSNGRRLPAWQELAVGAAAGAAARLLTTPIGNVVTRKQTASLVASTPAPGGPGGKQQDEEGEEGKEDAGRHPGRELSVGEILGDMWAERGVLGLWAGYSATLVLTLNPSVTFYLQSVLGKAVADSRGREGGGGGGATFLVAAVSKVVATAVTYPFQIAKAISQVSAPGKEEEGSGGSRDGEAHGLLSRRLSRLAGESIFATVYKMGRTEGVRALYDGLGGELLKAFLNHGMTMLSKEVVHKLLLQLYFFILAFVQRSPAAQALLRRRSREEFLRRFGKGQIAEGLARIKDGTLVLKLVGRAQNLIVTR